MPFAVNGSTRLYWRLQGDQDLPVLVLLNSIATDHSLYDRTVPHLLGDFRLLRMDTRGHGASDAPSGDYRLNLLASDVVAVMNMAGVARATVCGLSLGGMMAMSLALEAPDRLDRLILACTSAHMGSLFWAPRIAAVREKGTASIADAAIGRLFSPAFAEANKALIDTARFEIETMSDDGYAGCGAAIQAMDLVPHLGQIVCPTLVIAGADDMATPFLGHGDRIVTGIADANVAMIAGGHLACVENPEDFAREIIAFASGRPH